MQSLTQKRRHKIDWKIVLLVVAIGGIYLFGWDIINYVCTHNILRGQF
jgi:hypothetical protein